MWFETSSVDDIEKFYVGNLVELTRRRHWYLTVFHDNDILGWKRKIRDGLKADGMKVEQISISSDGRIKKLEAKY